MGIPITELAVCHLYHDCVTNIMCTSTGESKDELLVKEFVAISSPASANG